MAYPNLLRVFELGAHVRSAADAKAKITHLVTPLDPGLQHPQAAHTLLADS